MLAEILADSTTPTTNKNDGSNGTAIISTRCKVGAPGFEPGTPCSQIICKEGECAQLAHFIGEGAHISAHHATNVRILRGNVSVIVSVPPPPITSPGYVLDCPSPLRAPGSIASRTQAQRNPPKVIQLAMSRRLGCPGRQTTRPSGPS